MKKQALCLTLAMGLCMGSGIAQANMADENIVYEADVNTRTGEVKVITDKTSPTAQPAAALAGGGIRVIVNNKELTEAGVTVDGRTLVPMRAIGEALGAKVGWEAANQKVTIEKMLYQADSKGIATDSNRYIEMVIGSNQALINGSARALDVPAQVINGKTMVPIRAVGDYLEATTEWDEATKTVTIKASPSETAQGAKGQQEQTARDFGSAVGNRIEEINRDLEKELAEAKAKEKAAGVLRAYGYAVSSVIPVEEGRPPYLAIQIAGGENNSGKFLLKIVDKITKHVIKTVEFNYSSLENMDVLTKKLLLDEEYLDRNKFDYEFLVVV